MSIRFFFTEYISLVPIITCSLTTRFEIFAYPLLLPVYSDCKKILYGNFLVQMQDPGTKIIEKKNYPIFVMCCARICEISRTKKFHFFFLEVLTFHSEGIIIIVVYVLRSHIRRSEQVRHLLEGFYTMWWSQSLPRPGT